MRSGSPRLARTDTHSGSNSTTNGFESDVLSSDGVKWQRRARTSARPTATGSPSLNRCAPFEHGLKERAQRFLGAREVVGNRVNGHR